MDPKLAQLRTHVAQRLAEHRRHRAAHPPHPLPLTPTLAAQLDEIYRLLEASARDPHEWS